MPEYGRFYLRPAFSSTSQPIQPRRKWPYLSDMTCTHVALPQIIPHSKQEPRNVASSLFVVFYHPSSTTCPTLLICPRSFPYGTMRVNWQGICSWLKSKPKKQASRCQSKFQLLSSPSWKRSHSSQNCVQQLGKTKVRIDLVITNIYTIAK